DSAFRNPHAEIPLTARSVALAWSPWLIMGAFLVVSGVMRQAEGDQKKPLSLGFADSYYDVPVPTLHKEVERADRLVPPGATGEQRKEAATFKFTWLTAPGTPVFLAALVSMLLLRMSRAQVAAVFRKTVVQMKVPIPTIACMLGLSYVTKY